MRSNLLNEFAFTNKDSLSSINDYDVFKDKDLLDSLRCKIVENLIDNPIPEKEDVSLYINEQINKVTEGLDLTTMEISHLFNLIETSFRSS